MANISDYLKQILSSRYGKEVRQSIHDAIQQCYADGKAGSVDLNARQSITDIESQIGDVYNSESTYSRGEYCIYKNILYKCVTDITNPEEWNAEKWEKVTITVELRDISDSTVAFTQDEARENIESGESAKTLLGKIRKWLADLTAPAFAQMISSYTDLMANTASGYLPDALAVKDGFNLIKWKYHGAVSGGTALTLPSDYTELKVTSIFTNVDSEISITVNILRDDLSDSVTRFFEVGNLDTRLEIGARTNLIALYVCQKGGTDFLSSTYTKCYYR
ncbi:MAG: hypothetical protein J6C84_07040 [Lachnospiraceae bacterium]|nr:hypothetical protein [Lachnospiraceae bacterium]